MDLLPGKNFPPVLPLPSIFRKERERTSHDVASHHHYHHNHVVRVRAANYYFIPVGERVADSSAMRRWALLIKASLKDRF